MAGRFHFLTTLAIWLVLALGPAAATEPGHPYVGEWYNADYGIFPGFATLSLKANGEAAITGLDGKRRVGRHELRPDGRLVILMPADTEPYALRVIIDAVPLLEGGRLQLPAAQRSFTFLRAPWLKAEIAKATAQYQPPRPTPVKPPPTESEVRPEVVSRKPVPDKAATEPAKRAASLPAGEVEEAPAEEIPLPPIKRLWIKLGGKGSGPEGCDGPVLDSLRQAGWQLVESATAAEALVEIELSGIQNERSIWVGRYYKINYRINLLDAKDRRPLGSSEGAERASGDGWFEVCTDVADVIADEVEDLVEEMEDDRE